MTESIPDAGEDRPIPDSGVSPNSVPEPLVSPRIRVDEQGRIIPFTPEERALRTKAIQRMFEELAQIENDPNEDDREFFRAMDEDRPEFPLFKGMY